MKKLLVTTALTGLMLSAAYAQAPSSSTDSMKSDAPKASTSGMSSASTISTQKPDQLLATKIKGADVIGSDDKKIGDVSDLLFSKDGKLEAFVLSVGGFLGVGAKEVAMAPESVQLTQDKNENWQIKVSMNKDQLAQAPNFERAKEKTTTGSATSPSTPATPRGAPNTPPANRQ